MAIFARGTRKKPRRFSYDPRYYDPRKEEDLRKRMRIRSLSRRPKRSPQGIIFFVILLVLAVWVYLNLG
jgi:hypothetical protein